jgi:hypothetical protein
MQRFKSVLEQRRLYFGQEFNHKLSAKRQRLDGHEMRLQAWL